MKSRTLSGKRHVKRVGHRSLRCHPLISTAMWRRPENTEISGEDRAILAIAGFGRFISLLGRPSDALGDALHEG